MLNPFPQQNEKNINEQLTTKLGNTESRLNTKLAAANENLVSARNEIGKCEEKIVELEKVIKQKETQQFDLKGEIAGRYACGNRHYNILNQKLF